MRLTGTAASKGRAKGPARQIRGNGDLGKLQRGEVLVTTMTAPAMVTAMRRAAAIVTRIGGRTCHAAIVSRELGIPCVVAVSGAENIRTGALVTVDGLGATVDVED